MLNRWGWHLLCCLLSKQEILRCASCMLIYPCICVYIEQAPLHTIFSVWVCYLPLHIRCSSVLVLHMSLSSADAASCCRSLQALCRKCCCHRLYYTLLWSLLHSLFSVVQHCTCKAWSRACCSAGGWARHTVRTMHSSGHCQRSRLD